MCQDHGEQHTYQVLYSIETAIGIFHYGTHALVLYIFNTQRTGKVQGQAQQQLDIHSDHEKQNRFTVARSKGPFTGHPTQTFNNSPDGQDQYDPA